MPGLVGGVDVGLGDDLHQGDAGPVIVDQRGARLMDELGGVLFQVDAADAHGAAARLGFHVQATVAA